MNYDQGIVCGVEYQLQCVENKSTNVEISQSLQLVGLTSAQRGTEKMSYANLSGPVEPNEAEGNSFLDCIMTIDKLASKQQSMERQLVNSQLKIQDAQLSE